MKNQTIDTIRVLSNSLSDAVIITDKKFRIDWFNKVAKKFLGLNKKFKRKKINTLWKISNLENIYKSQKQVYVEVLLEKTATKMQPISILPLNGYLVFIVKNVKNLQHIEMLRQDFVANVSHEMRTPLTVIKGYIEMMADDLIEYDTDNQESLSVIDNQFNRLEILLKDLLLLSRLQQHDIDQDLLIQIDITAIVKQLVDNYRLLHADRYTFSLEVEKSLFILGKEKEIISCFDNLISNAVRYSPQGGAIIIAAYHQNGRVFFSVKDSGIGIDPLHIPRVTERFYRVDKSRSPQTGGTGLGLSIVKHILIRHKGFLYIESELGLGSLFRCDFPAIND